MANFDPDDMNVTNLTETRSQRAPDPDRISAGGARLPGTRWPASAGFAALAGIVLIGLAAWKLISHSTRDLIASEPKDDSA